jgi:small subunit ribosomal protein S20
VANIKSQIKRIKTNEKAQERNKSARSGLKTAIRRFKDAVTAGDSAKIKEELRVASKTLDVAVSKGIIHANAAANKKSALAKAANKVSK